MQIASGQHIEHGTTFISWMLRLRSVGLHITMPGLFFSTYHVTLNIWQLFRTLLRMT
jgi:hypothetical protein